MEPSLQTLTCEFYQGSWRLLRLQMPFERVRARKRAECQLCEPGLTANALELWSLTRTGD